MQIQGQVQGVGFRPYVYQVAHEMQLTGWVRNDGQGVLIEINATEEAALKFRQRIIAHPPKLAQITTSQFAETAQKIYAIFEILPSAEAVQPSLTLTPDLGLCQACRTEFQDPENRRFHYPFISCHDCGPRFSIVASLPFDRERTSMSRYPLCQNCRSEYTSPADRRFHAQTISCVQCGVKCTLTGNGDPSPTMESIAQQVIESWEKGDIVAIKGLGGFHLTCDACSNDAILKLRALKKRVAKPLALMAPSMQVLEKLCHISEDAAQTLLPPLSAINLLPMRSDCTMVDPQIIAPGMDTLGCMLPYTPLHLMLLQAFGKPIIATSANRRGAPIIYYDSDELSELAELILDHDREITLPQDDTVVLHSRERSRKILIRYARGKAPLAPALPKEPALPFLMACGAMIKSSFAMHASGNVLLSPYLGNLQYFEVEQRFRSITDDMLSMLDAHPDVIITDLHPSYPSSLIGKTIAEKYDASMVQVQHHEAHFAALLAEHQLIETEHPILGVIWDGAGLGIDDQIWGGEFMLYRHGDFNRISHLAYFHQLLGDKMAKEPRLAALSIGAAHPFLADKFTDQEWKLYTKLRAANPKLQSSSVGRLFDAAASILGLCDIQSFEGEAAMRLQASAQRYIEQHGHPDWHYRHHSKSGHPSGHSIIRDMIDDLDNGRDVSAIAAAFHRSLVEMIRHQAAVIGANHIGFSGGVFQNSLLIDMLDTFLGNDFQLLFHENLPSNDQNIAYGQLTHYLISQMKQDQLVP